jgi:hypothetical protein
VGLPLAHAFGVLVDATVPVTNKPSRVRTIKPPAKMVRRSLSPNSMRRAT